MRPILFGLLVLLCSRPAIAQFRGGIEGTVVDPDGAVIPDATVTLTSHETNISTTTQTNQSGVFVFSALAPGSYTLSVERDGFSKKTLEDVRVGAEQTQSLTVQLAVGQVTDTVAVSAPTVPLLDREGPTIGTSLTSREVENLPSFGRDPLQLVRLSPGVFGDGAQSNSGGTTQMPGSNRPSAGDVNSIFFIENAPQITANGTRPNSNLIQVDGVSVNSVAWGGSAVLTPNEESIKEIRITANNYSAENGREGGAQVMVVSKNGTNELHGSAFYKAHRPEWNAYQQWNGPGTPSPVKRDTNRFNQGGGSFGGPIIKNRMFGFVSYETLRNQTISSATTWFETSQYRQQAGPAGSMARRMLSFPGQDPLGNAISLTCAQVGLAATQCHDVAGGLDLGSPLTTPLGTHDPTFNQPGTPFGIGNGFDGVPDAMAVETASPTQNRNSQYNGRVDFHPTQVDLLAFSLYRVPTTTLSVNGRARTVNQWTSDRLSQSWTGIWNRALSANLLNEARFGASGWNFDELASNAVPWGLPISTIDKAGNVALAGWGLPGPGVFDQSTWSVRDTATLLRGRHSFKAGGEYTRAKFLDTNTGSARPTYAFRNLWDYANDAPYQETGNFDPITGSPSDNRKDLRFNTLAFFAQDDFRIKPNLTVNLGLRWDYYSPLSELHNLISNPILGTGASVLTGLTMKQGDLSATSKTNFGPQLGAAWTPHSLLGRTLNDRLVLRSGFGIGYNLQQLAILSNGRSNPPFTTSLTFNASHCCILYAAPSDVNAFTGWPSNPAAINTFDPNTGLPIGGAPVNLVGFPTTLHTPVTYRYSADAQYDLGHSWMASLGYQGSQSRNYARAVRLDLLYFDVRNPRVNNFTEYPNDAKAHYNALLAGVQHRFSKSFSVDGQYRFSRTTDQGSQDFYTDTYPFDINAWNGPADNDVTHTLTLWGVWTPTLFKDSSSWLEKTLGGWMVSGILTAHSGFPWTPTYSSRTDLVYAGSGYRTVRPAEYLGGGGQDFSNSTFMRPNGNFPNGALAYFTVPTLPATGIPPVPGVGRNSFRGPRYFDIDMTLGKAFGLPSTAPLGDQAKVNVQVTAYNLFNRINLMLPNTVISTDGVTSNPQFGQSQSAFAGRILDLQIRFSF
jgi:opacity protein-like surface antigen